MPLTKVRLTKNREVKRCSESELIVFEGLTDIEKNCSRFIATAAFCLLMLGGIRSMFSVRDYTSIF